MHYGQAGELKNEAPYPRPAAQSREKFFSFSGAPIAKDPEKAFEKIASAIAPEKAFDEFDIDSNRVPVSSLQEQTFDLLNPEPKVAIAPSEKVGPGEYHPGYCKQMYDFFNREKYRTITEEYTYKSGYVETKNKKVPNAPPEFSEFARSIGVTKRTLEKWRREHPEFAEAYDSCADLYEEFLVHHGLLGNYGAIFGKFVAVNRTRMKDKQETTTRVIDMRKVLDDIASGKLKPGGQLEALPGDGDDF